MLRCGGQVVRRESAKLIFAGSIPARTLRFEPCVERERRVIFCQKIVFKNTFSLLPLLFVPTKSKQNFLSSFSRGRKRTKKTSGSVPIKGSNGGYFYNSPYSLKQVKILLRLIRTPQRARPAEQLQAESP